MWELAEVRVTDRDKVEGYLRRGYEPFAATEDSYGNVTIWLKKETNAVYSKPEPVKRTGRRVAKKPKR